jgi:hypothetical protein
MRSKHNVFCKSTPATSESEANSGVRVEVVVLRKKQNINDLPPPPQLPTPGCISNAESQRERTHRSFDNTGILFYLATFASHLLVASVDLKLQTCDQERVLLEVRICC